MYEGAFSAGIPFLVLLGLAVVAFSIWRYRVKALREKRLREGSYVFPEDRPEWQQKPSAPTHPTMSPDVTADIDFLSSGTGSLIVSGSCLCRQYFCLSFLRSLAFVLQVTRLFALLARGSEIVV